MADGSGSGTFMFVPDEAYAEAYDAARSRPLTPRLQVQAGMFDLRIAYVEALAAAGFGDAPFDTLLGIKWSGVTMEFLHGLRTDFPGVDSSEVVGAWMASGNGRVSLNTLHADFPNEDLDGIVALAATGVTPAFVAALQAADVRGISADSVAALRGHGVDQAFVDHLAAKGPRGLSVDEVVRLAQGSR
jgi:hypothetical protein